MIYKHGEHLKVGFTCSTFDLLHAGHILMLEEAKQQCEYLICGIQIDPTIDRPTTKNKPVQSIVERMIQLKAVSLVDEVVVYNTEQDLVDLLQILPIDVRILGEEYKDKDFTGKKECENLAIAFYFNSRTHRFSSTELRNRVAMIEAAKADPSAKYAPPLDESEYRNSSPKVHSWTEP